jgi:hypothetical protein
MNVLQLPIEYLWLTDAYEPLDTRDKYLDRKHHSRSDIVFEHPACLTTEESARDQGAAANRQPVYYDVLVENLIDCHTEGGVLHEYIVFDKYNQAREWKKYLQYISSDDASLGKYKDGENIIPYYIRSYKSGYANKNDFVESNTEAIRAIIYDLKQSANINKYDLLYLLHDGGKSEIDDDIIYIKKENDIILYIIALLAIKKDVIYLPNNLKNSGSSNKSLKSILRKTDKYEFICKIINDDIRYPVIDMNEPMFFSHNSEKLIKLLRMSVNILEFNKNLKMCVLYIQLIRCFFIMNLNKTSSSSSQVSKTSKNQGAKTHSLVRAKVNTGKHPKYYSL